AQAARAALDRAVAAQSARIEEIDARRDLNAQLTGELQEAARRLQASVAGLAPDRAGPAALPLAPFRGDLPWPASGTARSAFGRGRTSRFSAAIQRNGILISAAEGDRVRAVHEGRVAYASPFTGFGNLVIVEHGEGDYSLYGHLRALGVARGDAVERQAVLGEIGVTPSGVPGLYFELRIDGRAVDPLQWLKRR
ncbi:MAG: murein hydrolase activator EnvC family protein, partial [Vicinamibacterales bacterium]